MNPGCCNKRGQEAFGLSWKKQTRHSLTSVSDIQVAEKSMWALTGGPMLRAQSARWLWFATATLDRGAAHANQLLREFALCAGPGPARAAQALLALLPAELQEALSQVWSMMQI